MSDKKPKSIPIKNIVSEDGAHELATSETMQPYILPAELAQLGGKNLCALRFARQVILPVGMGISRLCPNRG